MKTMKLGRKWIALIIMGVVLAYFIVPCPFLNDSSQANIRESAIRWLLHHNDSEIQNKLQVCFIGLGTTFDPQDRDFAPQDPPKEFVARFANFPVPVFSVSASTNASKGDSIGGYVADAQGKPGLVFAAGNIKRWSLGLAVCRGLYYEGGLSSAGYDIFILRFPFTWVPVWAHMLWVS